jgi:TetR/AcrR family transcriptional regulator
VILLYSKFENLEQEKKETILAACLDEFAQYGYQNSSTNRIVKKAEISKGLLFHYFGSKRLLYLYILDYVLAYYLKKIYQRLDGLPRDFFERVMEIGLIKLEIAYQEPAIYKIIIDAFIYKPAELEQEINERYKKIYEANKPLLVQNLDTSRFRDDIDQEKAMELILFAMEGVSNKYLDLFKNMSYDEIMRKMDTIIREYQDYMEILKYGVYR